MIETQLATILDADILYNDVGGHIPDRVIKFEEGPFHAYCAILEVGDELGTSGSDPSVRGSQAYAQLWSQDQVRMTIVTRFVRLAADPGAPTHRSPGSER
jgi:hypothetical protein